MSTQVRHCFALLFALRWGTPPPKPAQMPATTRAAVAAQEKAAVAKALEQLEGAEDAMAKIFCELEPADACAAALVGRRSWLELAESDAVWKEICARYSPLLATLKARPTCSLSYKRLLRAQVLSDTAARELMCRWADEVDGARWTKAHEGRRGERAFYWRNIRHSDGELDCETSLVAPVAGVQDVREEDEEEFAQGFAQAQAFDKLRKAGKTPEGHSPTIAFVGGGTSREDRQRRRRPPSREDFLIGVEVRRGNSTGSNRSLPVLSVLRDLPKAVGSPSGHLASFFVDSRLALGAERPKEGLGYHNPDDWTTVNGREVKTAAALARRPPEVFSVSAFLIRKSDQKRLALGGAPSSGHQPYAGRYHENGGGYDTSGGVELEDFYDKPSGFWRMFVWGVPGLLQSRSLQRNLPLDEPVWDWETEEVVAEHPWRVAWGELATSTYIRAKIDARVDESAEGDDEEAIITGVHLSLVEEEREGTDHGGDGSCFPEKRNADIDELLRRLQEPDFAKSWV